MTNFYMMVGLPGSGKSTISKRIENCEIISSDTIRKELYGNEKIQGDSKLVFKIVEDRIINNLKNNKDTVYDATNLNYKRRKLFLDKIKDIPNISKKCLFMHTSYENCLINNKNRKRNVPENVIKNMYLHIDIPQFYEGWDYIIILSPNNNINYDIINKMNNLKLISHDTHYHNNSIGEHCITTLKNIKEKENEIPKKRFKNLQIAAFLHDIGKEFCKDFKDINGNTTIEAHYYYHEHVSAYESIFYLLLDNSLTDLDVLYIADLIQLHMRMFNVNTDKSKNKLLDMVGKDEFEDLVLLHEADILS